jgi:DNA polymerase-3 subunit gamma/tau
MAKATKTTSKPAVERPSRGYTVLARRYRPQQFDECIGQEHIARALKNAIESGRVAHSYLFTGVRGVGKTSMARIFAKALNCEKGPTTRPCDVCDICRSVATGDDVDVVEIDGASNRGINEVRELRQAVQYRPSRARHRVYIIDEVHMLTKEAFNALLKTLEEPPPHVKFIFATTEPEKIPITILSRCQRFDFAGLEPERIRARLKEIVEAEGMSADEEALETIARRAAGSMRDGQSLLDQLLAFGGDHLHAEDVHRLLGTANDDRIIELAAAMFVGNSADCLARVESAVAAGVQLGEWVEQMLTYLRDLLVLNIDSKAPLISMPNRLRPTMLSQLAGLTPERLIEIMDLLAVCRSRMRSTTYSRALLELTLVRICRLDEFLDLAGTLPTSPGVGGGSPSDSTAGGGPGSIGGARPAQFGRLPSQVDGPPRRATGNPPTLEPSSKPAETIAPENVHAFWRALAHSVRDVVVVAMLKQAVNVEFEPPEAIWLSFPSRATTAYEYVREADRLKPVEQAARDLAGRQIRIHVRLLEAGSEAPPELAIESQVQLRERAAREPIVRRAEEVLGARILSVDRVTKSLPAATGVSTESEVLDT